MLCIYSEKTHVQLYTFIEWDHIKKITKHCKVAAILINPPLTEKHGQLSFHTNLSRSLVYNCESGDVGSIPGCATNLQSVSEQVTYTKSLE